MTMKTAQLILACGLAAVTAPAAEELRPSTLNIPGIPTPLEEYGLSIGDVTVSRVINPLGQLRAGTPIMIYRHLIKITNPWAELSKGTAVILNNEKKAVVMNILPAKPPAQTLPAGAGRLLVEVDVEEIESHPHKLIWEQELRSLNHAENAEERAKSVKEVREKLRAGCHLIINNERVVVIDSTLTNELDSGLDRDLVLTVHYQSVETGKGTLVGRPSNSGASFDPAWNFTDTQNVRLPNDSVQLVSWKQVEKTGVSDTLPGVTVLHRSYGVLRKLELTGDKEVQLTAGFKQGVEDHMHTFVYRIPWSQQVDERGEMMWMMNFSSPNSNVTELYRVNDTNIRFTVRPESLLAANRKAAEILKAQNTFKFSPGNMDPAMLTTYLTRLEEIAKSDASQSIKLDVRRRAVISLASHYEHMAESYKALAMEHLARADHSENRAKDLERRAWYNNQQITILTNALHTLDPTAVPATGPLTVAARPVWATDAYREQWPDWAGSVDGLNKFQSITQMEGELKQFKAQYATVTPDQIAEIKLTIETHRRRGAALPALAHDLRVKAKEHRGRSDALQPNIIQYYSRAMQLWTEYVVRAEGLARDKQRNTQPGVIASQQPPDPLIPEIYLRQAWIYRQLGQPELATDKTQDVLKAAVQQKIDNLTRYGRIFLVARSQIADTLSESAKTVEDYIDANEKYENMLRSEPEEFDLNQIELKLLRGLHQANNKIRTRIVMLEIQEETLSEEIAKRDAQKKERPPSYVTRLDRLRTDLKKLKQSRMDNWAKMSLHAARFIERTGADDQETSYNAHFQSGEVRYFQIIANKALGKDENVQLEMEVLLSNESTPEEQRQAWAATRVRVVIDIANMLYSYGKELEAEAEKLRTNSGTPVTVTIPSPDGTPIEVPNWKPLLDQAPQCYRGAMVYYQWALDHDQTYRSQLLLRQQIAFCHERLGEIPQALEVNETVTRLAQMHPDDVNKNPSLRVTRILSELRKKNLERLLDQRNRTQPNN